MAQNIPLAAVANQALVVTLGAQNCQINVYQKTQGLFLDLYIGFTPVVVGALCLNLTRIVRDAYLGFSGDLCFNDTQGATDPYYTGFGTTPRYLLTWLQPSDLPAGVA